MIYIETKEELNKWIIYMYTFPNGKRYIGKSKRPLSRRQGSFFNRYKNCTALWNAIQKYGIENIEQKILFEREMTDEEASRLEQICILMFKTNANRFDNPKYGYNLTDGGEGISGWKPSKERYEKLVEQMHEFHKKRKGTHHSSEAKKKMSDAKIGKPNKSIYKAVVAIHNDTHEELFFESGKEAAEYFKVSPPTISSYLHNKKKPNKNINYTFKFLSTNND